jgi:hypothetical protein
MPVFVPPSSPPALVQPLSPQKVSDRPQALNLAQTPHSSDRENTSQPILRSSVPLPISSTVEDPSLGQTTPEPARTDSAVVEFYYANPKDVSIPPVHETPTTTGESATLLGSPIAVGQRFSEPVLPTSSPFPLGQSETQTFSLANSPIFPRQPDESNPTLVLKGLDTVGQSSKAKILLTQERGGAVREFNLLETTPPIELSPPQGSPIESPQPPDNEPPSAQEPTGVVEVVADRQEYDQRQRIVTAQGNVIVRFPQGILAADRLQVNLVNKIAVAEGQVVLKRGDQVLRGDRFEYYFVQDSGTIFKAKGEVNLKTAAGNFSTGLSTEQGPLFNQPLSEGLIARQPLQQVTTSKEDGYQFSLGSIRDLTLLGEQGGGLPSPKSGGQINHIRFQAERVNFYPGGWDAINFRLTNDPFSPPEFEVQADTAKFRNIEPLVDELTTTNSRVVFDQGFAPPIFQDRLIFDRRPRQPGLFSFGFDGDERGGLFVQRSFNLIQTETVNFTITPQYLLQKAFLPDSFTLSPSLTNDGGILNPTVFGLRTNFDAQLGPRTEFLAFGSLPSLNLDFLGDNLRANVRLKQEIGDVDRPHLLSLQYNYRERLFNGSLGFQTVQSSIGVVLTSPKLSLGETGIELLYQGSIQNIDADTDQVDLLPAVRDNNRINLTRYQAAALLSRNFYLWRGEILPPTPEEGLRYTPIPVEPYVQLTTGLTGVTSYYSNGDSQPSLTGSIGLQAQFGHFSRPYFDYTAFNITYSQGIRGDESPFTFDRFVDQSTISFGVTQQIYGPFRAGVQGSFSFNSNEEISTDYFVEYSRRTYSVLLRYNPVLAIGSFNLKVNNFNWVGDPEPFEGTGIRPVIDGVTR